MVVASAIKDGAVIRESLGQAMASYLAILEMMVDDLGYVCIDFIMWSLSVTILIEFDLGFSANHTFAYSFNEVVSFQVIVICSQWEAWLLPQGAKKIDDDLCRCSDCLYRETNGQIHGQL